MFDTKGNEYESENCLYSVSSFFCLFINNLCYSDQRIIAGKVNKLPVIDGKGDDIVWNKHPGKTTYEKVADINILLKAIYTNDRIFFLVDFPDPDESRKHKTWVWNKDKNRYIIRPDREDCFVFKWNMMPAHLDLSVYSDNKYVADIWFWKANRTDPVGFADDKIQNFSMIKMSKSSKMKNRAGKNVFATFR